MPPPPTPEPDRTGAALAPAPARPPARLWAGVLALALGTAVSNGFARFGYGLILPAMQSDLDWSYATAGWINTANAAGYLLGALLALSLAGRVAPGLLFRWGMAVTSVSLLLCGFSEDLLPLVVWRLLAGIGGAPVFIAGGAMAAASFPAAPARNALAIALYFGGAGFGILLTALGLPPLLERPEAWPYAWWALGLASLATLLPSWLATRGHLTPPRRGAGATRRLPWTRLLPSLCGYFLFAAGYIVYMTFVVAWMRDKGAETAAVAATWSLLGLTVMLSPFVWRRLLAAHAGGGPLALASLATGIGAALPLLGTDWSLLLASAAVFGLSFFIAPTAVTAFSRKNLPQPLWGAAVALYTSVFALGQMLGPVAAGWLADATGDLAQGLLLGAALLGLASLAAVVQTPLASSEDAEETAAREGRSGSRPE
ncbi:hypothetical protein AY600_02305 [Phormidium willei BDU 130791]|nr:hypothetical protein AY600_02305 [Phormidium willei BDU 130791]